MSTKNCSDIVSKQVCQKLYNHAQEFFFFYTHTGTQKYAHPFTHTYTHTPSKTCETQGSCAQEHSSY